MVDIKALFEYNWYCNRKFLESMAKLPWDKVIEDRGASFGSMRDIFVHILEGEEGWLKTLASGKIGKRPTVFKDIEAMKQYMDQVEGEGRAYISKLSPAQLTKEFKLRNNSFPVEDFLMHVVEEEIHHRGELLCLMWQIDSPPPYRSYLNYLLKD
jgi:uncharacterized damage-inducible protein DinB